MSRICLIVLCLSLLCSCAADNHNRDAADNNHHITDDDNANDDSADDDSVDDDVANDDVSDDDTADDDSDDDDTADDDGACEPPGGGALQPLRAGVAVGDLYAPIGVSLGGFGSRHGPSHPLAFALSAAMGRYDRLQVKALTLDNGADRLVIVRTALAAVNDLIYAQVIAKVCELTGVDLTEKLWISAIHTHSGPASYSPMPAVFADTGLGKYMQPVVDGIVASIAAVIAASMENLEPAALATGLDINWDPDNLVAADRRCQDDPPQTREHRLFVTRIDCLDGSPLAILLGFAVHGTMLSDWHYASDMMGWAEYMLQERFDEPVEVFALQTSAGDQNPVAPNQLGHHVLAQLEILGKRAADDALALWNTLQPAPEVEFEMVAKRIEISREAIGYQPGEFGWINPWTGEWHDYEMGALYCGSESWEQYGSLVDCGDPETSLVDGYLLCYMSGSLILWAMNPWLTTQVAAIKLNSEILLLFPGELTSHLATATIEQAAARYAWPAEHLHAFGYSNDYQMYLQTEETWMQGGYETTISIWGPKFGDWLAGQILELGDELFTPEDEDNLAGAPAPWIYTDADQKLPEPEASDRTPQMLTQPDSSYERFAQVSVEWSGGFTTIDDPRIVVEQQQGREFKPVILPTGRPFTNQDFRTIQEYAPAPDYDESAYPALRLHKWRLAWELTVEVPAGTYRFHITGAFWDGTTATPYELITEPFAVNPNSQLSVLNLAVEEVASDQFRITCAADYPPIPGSHRLLNPDYSPNDPSPVRNGEATVTIDVEGGETEFADLVWDAERGCFSGLFTKTQTGLPHQAQIIGGDLHDGWGNYNSEESETVPF